MQAAVALCVWSVTTFWGLVFTPVALAIVGLMYWDEIEVRMRHWRVSVARLARWRQRRSASSKEAKASKAASSKSKGKRTDKPDKAPVSASSGDPYHPYPIALLHWGKCSQVPTRSRRRET